MATRIDDGSGDELRGGYGGAWLQVRGSLVIVVLLLLTNLGATIWASRSIELHMIDGNEDFRSAVTSLATRLAVDLEARRKEHILIRNELGKSTCIASLTPEERKKFREEVRAWSQWCWWVIDDSPVVP